MKSYQYIGTEYTMIRLVNGEEKVKVVHGEIIETDRFTEKQMKRNGFQIAEKVVEPIKEEKVVEPKTK